jgi:diguanylate cyclase
VRLLNRWLYGGLSLPDNYYLIYNEIAGTPAKETLDSAFKKALKQLPHETTEQGKWVNRWEKLLKQNNWDALPALLGEGMDTSVNFSTQWPDAIRELLQAWDAKQLGLDLPRKREALERVLINFGNDPLLAKKIQAVASGWQGYGVTSTTDSKSIELVGDETPKNEDKSQYPLVEPSNGLSITAAILPEVPVSADTGITAIAPDQFQEAFRTLQDMLRQSLNHGLMNVKRMR